jgi:hypothetical protein
MASVAHGSALVFKRTKLIVVLQAVLNLSGGVVSIVP